MHRLNDYNNKKQNSQLDFNKTLSQVQQSVKKVPWSYPAKDQYMRDGFSVLITNKKTQGYMAIDIGTKALGIDEAYVPTITPQHPGPITRAMFVIRKIDKVDVYGSDDVIRYGQKVRIEMNPYLSRKALYLSSVPLGPNFYSPVTQNQEASITTKDVAFNNTWVIDLLDPNFRFEKQGTPVECNDPVLIRHVGTNKYLSSDLNKIKNQFGTEYEVCVNNYASKNRSQNLALEKDGKITGDLPTKFQED